LLPARPGIAFDNDIKDVDDWPCRPARLSRVGAGLAVFPCNWNAAAAPC
jgi:hypothetical protein